MIDNLDDEWIVSFITIKLTGEGFGIVAGAIGIHLSRTKNHKRMRCLWKAFIALVSYEFNVQVQG